MLFRYSLVVVLIAVWSFTENKQPPVASLPADSSWNRISVPCFAEIKRSNFREDKAPVVQPSDFAKIDSLGVITEVHLLADTVCITIKKQTFWGTNTQTNSVERKVLRIDSLIEKIRWECTYAGPGKGNCTTCQITDCSGQPLGPLKTGRLAARN